MSWCMLIIVISVVVFSLFDEALMGVLIFMRDDTPRMAFSPISIEDSYDARGQLIFEGFVVEPQN